MIVVTVDQTGDWAEADDERAALVAARELLRDERRARPRLQGARLSVSFEVAGTVVRRAVCEQVVWDALR